MPKRHLQVFVLVSIAILILSISACTRSASTPPPSVEDGNISADDINKWATMDAVRAALLTQTYQPEVIELPTETPTPTIVLPTLTPVPTGPTDTPVVVINSPTPLVNPGQEQTYLVQAGEWVISIANKFGVDPNELIERNELQYPYDLNIGQEIIIPAGGGPSTGATNTPMTGGREYIVQTGEWIYSIARKFGVDPQTIIDANSLEFPYTIYPGDVLHIP